MGFVILDQIKIFRVRNCDVQGVGGVVVQFFFGKKRRTSMKTNPTLLVTLLLAALLYPGSIASQKPHVDVNPKLERFLTFAEKLRRQHNVPGVGLGIVQNNEIVFSGGLGLRDLQNEEPVTADTLFAIGSNTKAFTGLIVTKIVSAGKLDWFLPIKQFMPSLELSDSYVTEHVTLADACSHMTGLARRDELWKGKAINREQVFQQVKDIPFDFSLRKSFSYNNHMYVLVGKVIEAISGKSWEENVRREIFKPLKMKDSYLTYDEYMKHPQKSIGYAADGTTRIPYINTDNIGPVGSISSTPRDLAKWLQLWVTRGNLGNHRVLTPMEYKTYAEPRSASMAGPNEFKSYWAGWGTKILNGEVQFLHSGGIGGHNSMILARPADGFGILVLTNKRSDYKDQLVKYAEQIFLE